MSPTRKVSRVLFCEIDWNSLKLVAARISTLKAIDLYRRKILFSCSLANRLRDRLNFCFFMYIISNRNIGWYFYYFHATFSYFGFLCNIWDKVFKNGPCKICGRQPLKKLKGHGLLKQKGCLPQILLDPSLNTLSH